ncbi:MAG: hypothetical protein SPF22_04025 [Candidatus Onthovivens sp.]|nr:hypothetical protein [Candidatus Onthovivens sp.]
MARQRIINYHTSGTTAPLSDDIYYGELVVSHNSIGNTKIYTKVTNPSGDTNEGKIATFIDEPQIDEKISNSVNGLADIVQNLANLTITDIKATTPINATAKAIVTASCGNTVTISHVADKTEQSGFKKLTTDTYGHVTGGEDVVISDISGLTGFGDAIKGAETKLAYSSAGTGNAVTSISVNDHTITANFGKEFSEAGHKHDGSDITSGKVGINYLPTSTAVTSSSDDTTIPTSKAVYDAVSGTVNGLNKEASSAQGKFVRTVIQKNGLVSESKDFINANDIKLSAVTPSSTTVKEEYALYNGNGAQLGDSIKIYKDQSLVSITLEDNDGSGKTGQYLKYTYIDVNGDTQSTYVNISSLLVEAEFKSGVTADSNGIVHGVVDSASEGFLTVGAEGFKLSGVQDAINNAINGLDSTGTTSEFHAITSITITDGKITEVGQTDKINSAITSVSAESVDLSGVKNADDLKAIEALTATSGILRKTGENTWDLANVVTSLDGVTGNGSLVDALTVKNAIGGVDTKLQELSGSVQTFSAATVAEIARVEGKLSDDEKVVAESINQLRAKVDKVQEGAGLNENGSYAPHSTANYIAGATSLDDADMKLDSAVKALAESMTGSTADINELSGQVQTLSGSVVDIKNREPNYASAITINGNVHTVANNGVDLGSYLSANTTYVKAVSQANHQWTGDTRVVDYVTTTFTMQDGTTFSINDYNIIDGGSY